ncbi:hypothetical protein GCM10027405_02530 [Arthrobacter alkaliphilus]
MASPFWPAYGGGSSVPRPAATDLPPALAAISAEREVPRAAAVMVGRQRLHVGRTHAGWNVTIYVEDTQSASPTTVPKYPASPAKVKIHPPKPWPTCPNVLNRQKDLLSQIGQRTPGTSREGD